MEEQETIMVKYQLENYSFLSIPRTKQQSARYRNNNNYAKNDTIRNFFTNIYNII